MSSEEPRGQSSEGSSDSETYHRSIETKSLTESILEHVVEGGLRYHAYHAGKYPFPNDDVEQQCDEMRHVMTLELCDGKAFYAPVEDLLTEGAEVLDLGKNWNGRLVHGIVGAPNVQFLVDDIEHENGWDYPENHFDYIHIRHTLHSIKNRRDLLERAYKHLKPGGYLEIQELHYEPQADDSTLTPETTYRLRDFFFHLSQGLLALGADLHAITHVADDLRELGFEKVTQTTLKCPIGVWPKKRELSDCGQLLKTVIIDGLKGMARKPFVHGLGWTMMQLEMFLVEVRKATADVSFHTFLPFHAIHARKPLP
ncbi:unnamed protein product [Parascedosporium putredinis]|uniref:Methyltransferase n=1 Tax=Parascedosporium putredinis TaxID=1442378 RepID=A0A9P1MC83_9PEZI|nr:unnamed protein product [Parascedosporium putredinis]CAI7996098.1 unnamed protein product [Parascedosporium putredinis]